MRSRGIADELAQQLVLGQQRVLQCVRGQEAVLADQEGRLGLLGNASRDGGQVGGLLDVAGEEDAPARVGHGHDVVVAGVDVERLAGQRPRTDVEHDRQPLAADDVQDFLHQHEALAGREVGDAAAGERKALRGGCRGVLGLGLDERERRAPQVGGRRRRPAWKRPPSSSTA